MVLVFWEYVVRARHVKYLFLLVLLIVAFYSYRISYRLYSASVLLGAGAEIIYGNQVIDSWHDTSMIFSAIYGVEYLGLNGCVIDDRVATSISAFPEIATLWLHITNTGDEIAPRIRGLRNLKNLSVSHTNVGDLFVNELSGNKYIERLSMSGTRVTNAGIKMIGDLANLKKLDLSLTCVSDEAIKHLSGLRLLEIDLHKTEITEDGLKHLNLEKVTYIDISGNSVSCDVAWMNQMVSLRHADISCTGINGAAIEELISSLRFSGLAVDKRQISNWVSTLEKSEWSADFSVMVLGSPESLSEAYARIESYGVNPDTSKVRYVFIEDF